MDVDNEIFYDEMASFMSQPEDYSLEDLDEIIRSTDSHLDASFDMNVFKNDLGQSEFNMAAADLSVLAIKENVQVQQNPSSEQEQQFSIENKTQINFDNDYHFNFMEFPSPDSSRLSVGRTSSPLSIGDGNFIPDDFINFLNDDDIKIDDMTTDYVTKINDNHRNTPSPTGSCTSSSGSSTSGVQSDASSEVSMSQNYKSTMGKEGDDDLLEFIKFKNERSDQDIQINQTYQHLDNGPVVIKDEKTKVSAANTLSPITMPVQPIVSIQSAQPVNFLPTTITPVQTVPLKVVNPVVNINVPTAIKIENKPSSTNTVMAQPIKLLSAATCSPKLNPPPNAKPKTIYLSSNDFKTLMQKMNTNGKKITGANGEIPKIIMKTANGKVIAANKITKNTSSNANPLTVSPTASINNSLKTPVSSSKSKSLQVVSKMVKPADPIMETQQLSKTVTTNAHSGTVVAATRTTLNRTKGCRTDFSMLKGLTDDKLLKKQLRMLKNRQSASLSRKKKKEYVERLENRIGNLEKENYSLKGENSSLRSQLMAFAQTCNCKHGNVSEFILNTLNMDGKSGEDVLKAIDTSYLMNKAKQHLNNCSSAKNNNLIGTRTSATHHVKIAPKPTNCGSFVNNGFKQRMTAATVKKNVAVLFAMAFMVTLNVGNFQNYLNKSSLENSIDTSATGVSEEPGVQTGRHLMWVPTENEFHEQTGRTKRDTDMANMPPPPLHFLHPVNRTLVNKMNGTSTKDEPPIKRSSIRTTATYANATQENMRLARNLHKWIGGNDYLNLTGTGIGNDFEKMKHFKFDSDSYMDYDLPLQAPIGTKQKRKIINSQTPDKNSEYWGDNINSLDIYKPRISEEYLRLFRGIKRQDDTFYVLSFNMDHILLPASTYNKSSRPKMSLMLPAGDPLHNGDIVLMQIDCEVINTTELEIKSHMIPEKLRPSKYSANVPVNRDDVSNNNTTGSASFTVTKHKDFPLKREESKEKPSGPRTYFMMGPKNQASTQTANSIAKRENIVKRKPTILKLNANDSVIGSGILNVGNLSLFSRMRESIGSQTNGFISARDMKK